MKDDLRYTPSDCFETYPFRDGWESQSDLETIGGSYYDFRAELMAQNNEGLTKTYNRFHDPYERAIPRIEQLRQLHTEMDRARPSTPTAGTTSPHGLRVSPRLRGRRRAVGQSS